MLPPARSPVNTVTLPLRCRYAAVTPKVRFF
eukprot:COSAG02_NODE_41312_length_396_cov_0.521886_1_plen_30_part_01